jgi:hypothetical protein
LWLGNSISKRKLSLRSIWMNATINLIILLNQKIRRDPIPKRMKSLDKLIRHLNNLRTITDMEEWIDRWVKES